MSEFLCLSHLFHGKGEWMLSYRYRYMPMEQNRDGSSRVRDTEIISPTGGGFLVVPQWMDMEMHMFGFMLVSIKEKLEPGFSQ